MRTEYRFAVFVAAEARTTAQDALDRIRGALKHNLMDGLEVAVSVGPLAAEPKRQARVPEHPGPDASEAQIKAFYKATAPREDLKFTMRYASPELQQEINLLLAGEPTAKDAQRMRDKRRVELAAAERAEPKVRPTEYKDWHTSVIPPSEQCLNCGRLPAEHNADQECPQGAFGPYRAEPGDTYQQGEARHDTGWQMVPAAEFEAKFARIAAGWNGGAQ